MRGRSANFWPTTPALCCLQTHFFNLQQGEKQGEEPAFSESASKLAAGWPPVVGWSVSERQGRLCATAGGSLCLHQQQVLCLKGYQCCCQY